MSNSRPLRIAATAAAVAAILAIVGWSARGSDTERAEAGDDNSSFLVAGDAETPSGGTLVIESPESGEANEIMALSVEAPSTAPSAADDADPQDRQATGASGPDSAGTTALETATPTTTTTTTTASSGGTTGTTGTTSAPPPTAASTTTTARPADTAAPARTGYFPTLGPGSKLPSGAECAARVRPVPENVPENVPYNRTRGRSISGTYFTTNSAIAKTDYESRIDGDFVGSTDEIIQWASCKWGFDEDRVRAVVYAESSWFAGRLGDCGEQTQERTGGDGGCASVGLIQVRSAEIGPSHNPGMYPAALESSAMNLDYALAIRRLCYEGLESWLSQRNGNYGPGDEWGCIGRWFSGSFNDGQAGQYKAEIRQLLNERKWESQWVGCPGWRESFYCTGLNKPVS